jgi:hypothetical protein
MSWQEIVERSLKDRFLPVPKVIEYDEDDIRTTPLTYQEEVQLHRRMLADLIQKARIKPKAS